MLLATYRVSELTEVDPVNVLLLTVGDQASAGLTGDGLGEGTGRGENRDSLTRLIMLVMMFINFSIILGLVK